uniref:Polyprenol-phosphate-mannose--protein mannosyltransferase n=1 Tax=uncultured Streptomyces sp. TaxID=174707 RepID=A0A060C0X0_9ACTN|nr:CAZy families GT39 protein [uncultured Streptomyces sp.]
MFSWIPLSLQSLWQYHVEMYQFHVSLETPHSYASPAWQWPLLLRPTSMYFHLDSNTNTVNNIYSMPNPLVWYASVIAVIYLIARMIMRRKWIWQQGIVLVAIAATYVPWLLYPERTIFSSIQ